MKKLTLLMAFCVFLVALNAVLLLEDNFTGTVGTLLTANGWTNHSGTSNFIPISATDLSYTGYASFGGGSASLLATGEDVNRAFTSQTSGGVYAAFLINVSAAQTGGDYFFHFSSSPLSTQYFRGKVFIQKDTASNNFRFGITNTGAIATAATTGYSYVYGTTYLIVLKYEFIDGTNNDVVHLWVNPSFSPEPAPLLTSTDAITSEPGNIGTIALRQGGSTTGPTLLVDGIRVGTSWADVASAGGNPLAATPVISPGSGTFFAAFNAEISCTTPGATIYYTLDGTDPDLDSDEYLGPINISSTTTLKAIAYADGFDPSLIAAATYSFPSVITVANIAELRAGTVGSQIYYLSGEAIITFKQALRNQKYIQDGTAAILIDDPSGVITTPYDLYDGITGIYGTLALYFGLLEFVPATNTLPATSTGNVVIPEIRTLASLTSADQAKLIKVVNVTLDATSGNFLTYAQNIDATQGATTLTMRTFPNTDYSGTPIPTEPQNITCLVGEYTTGMQISPRFLSDFEPYDDGTVPVELSSFTALLTAENSVKLSWVTQTETGVQGYYLYRNSSDALGSALLVSPLIEGTNSSEQQSYSFTDAEIFEPGIYYYWLQNVDYDGATDFHGPVSVVYSMDNEGITPELPQQTKLLAVYPNPFNPTAIIPFSLAKTAEVNIRVFNSRGQLMRDFGLSTKAPGSYQIAWDGRDAKGSECASGVYYFVLQAGKDYFQRKAVLVK